MAEQKRKSKTSQMRAAEQETASNGAGTTTAEKNEKLKAELDDLLDEIDEVLEENAEEFVKGYVQKGGQ